MKLCRFRLPLSRGSGLAAGRCSPAAAARTSQALTDRPSLYCRLMEPGDVLFFNGSLVHGSAPNTTTDRFRRALIGHYIEGDAEQVADYYHPALRMDGTPLTLRVSEGAGACGEWHDGGIALTGRHGVARRHE